MTSIQETAARASGLESMFGGSWFIPPGAYSTKNCEVITCKSCGSETYVLRRHHAAGYMCSNCVQANSYA